MQRILENRENVKSLPLYVQLFTRKVKSSDEFIDQITNPEHPFYGAARDVAREILCKTENWKWLANRIDDFGNEAERAVAKKVQRWKFRSLLGCNKMPLCDPQSTIKWLFERMVNEYKNLFDPNRANYLDLQKMDKLVRLEALQTGLEWEAAA